METSSRHWGAECEAAEMIISTSKYETIVLSRTTVDCFLPVGSMLLPQVEKVMLTSLDRLECEIDVDVDSVLACGEERAKSKGETVSLPANLFQLTPMFMSWQL